MSPASPGRAGFIPGNPPGMPGRGGRGIPTTVNNERQSYIHAHTHVYVHRSKLMITW